MKFTISITCEQIKAPLMMIEQIKTSNIHMTPKYSSQATWIPIEQDVDVSTSLELYVCDHMVASYCSSFCCLHNIYIIFSQNLLPHKEF